MSNPTKLRRLAALAARSVAGANTHFLAAGPGWTSATARKAPLTPAPAILASLGMNPAQKPFSLNRGASIRAEYYDKTLAEADAFLVDLGWIKK